MKKTVLLGLIMTSLLSARADQEEVIDHSANLTSSFELTSGTRVTFDLDQCSRFGFIAMAICTARAGWCIGILGDAEKQYGINSIEAQNAASNVLKWFVLASCSLIPKIVANLIMAKKELDRGEGARGIEHLGILSPLVQWYVLCTEKQHNDRKAWNRISWALMPFSGIGSLIYTVNEPYAFFYDLSDGKWPVSIE